MIIDRIYMARPSCKSSLSCLNIHRPILQLFIFNIDDAPPLLHQIHSTYPPAVLLTLTYQWHPAPSSPLHSPSPYPALSALLAIVVRGAGRGFLCCSAITHTTPPPLLHLFALKKVGRGVLFPVSAGKYISYEIKYALE